jgi:cytochrome c oxidase cbb3-type subunit III
MGDFISSGWSWFILIATALSIVACVVILFTVMGKKVASTADNTTGHVWDGDLKEANNPLPAWWVGLFVLTIAFAAVYLYLYPGLGSFKGVAAWSSGGSYQKEVDAGQKSMKAVFTQFASMDAVQLSNNPQAMAIAQRLFLNNCAQCHGSDARGSQGFPNLTDQDWLYGGKPENIVETITKGRAGNMPPMGAAVGNSDDVRDLANYVLSLSGSPHDSLRAGLGKSKYSACAACHGMDGKGNTALGAPNLTDDVWLHGWGKEFIIEMIQKGKTNAMPAQQGRLSEEQIKVLGAYVWGLSNQGLAK